MSIARHEGRMQLCCDSCPASHPDTFAADEFAAMIAAARADGWSIRKKPPPADRRGTTDLFGRAPRIAGNCRDETYSYACLACAAPATQEGLF